MKRDLWHTSSGLVVAPVFDDLRRDGNPKTVIFLLNDKGEGLVHLHREEALDLADGLLSAVAGLDDQMREYRTEQLRKLQEGDTDD